jgi:uncharacterized protein (TIGR00251 family)
LSAAQLTLRATKGGVRLEVKVKVRASRTAVLGVESECLSVALAAPPVDNAANEALRRLLAEQLSIPRQSITIVSGEKSRRKLLEIQGLTPDDVAQRLALPK